jgi:hypothetical protein
MTTFYETVILDYSQVNINGEGIQEILEDVLQVDTVARGGEKKEREK